MESLKQGVGQGGMSKPTRRRPRPSSMRRLKGIVGALRLIWLNRSREAFIFRWYVSSSARLKIWSRRQQPSRGL